MNKKTFFGYDFASISNILLARFKNVNNTKLKLTHYIKHIKVTYT